MPLYEYECANGHWHEELVSIGTTSRECPCCDSVAEKRISLPADHNRTFIRANINGQETTFRYHDEFRRATRSLDHVGGPGIKDPPHTHVRDKARANIEAIGSMANDKRVLRDTWKQARFNVRNGIAV